MLNVLFSTTRQWNVGDEFILFGAINLIKSVFSEEINPIIYNRHPDLRTDLLPIGNLKDVKLCAADELTILADANYRIGFRDNSFKNSLDGEFLDLVVFAGTPEWSNNRCLDLYRIIEKFNLPTIALGIGNCIQEHHDLILRNMNKFQLFTVRSPDLVDSVKNFIDVQPQYLPCPSLCSSKYEKIRTITSVKNIGLIYSCDEMRSEINNCVPTQTYNYLIQLFRQLIVRLPEYHFSLVCHYVDELPFVHSDFPNTDAFYSFDSKDYYDIYSQFDLVVGARVHGIGCAASMGIPGICVVHDFRGETVSGFFAEKVSTNQSLESAIEILEYTISTIESRNKRLIAHITKTAEEYKALIGSIKLTAKKLENYKPSLRPPINNIFEGRDNLFESLRELRSIPNPKINDFSEKIKELENNILQKDLIIENQSNVIEQQTHKINKQSNEIECQYQKISEQANEIEQQRQKINEQIYEIAQQNLKINEKTSEIEKQNSRISEQLEIYLQCKNQIEALSNDLIACNEKINFMSCEIDRKNAEIDSLYHSKSWKITAPLRKVFSFFKRILKGKHQT